MTDEVLAIGYAPGHGHEAFPVVAEAPPSVVVLRAPAAALHAVAVDADVAIVRAGDGTLVIVGDDSVLDRLSPSERRFVDAWGSGQNMLDRAGDGRR